MYLPNGILPFQKLSWNQCLSTFFSESTFHSEKLLYVNSCDILKLHGKFRFFNDSYFVVTEEEIYSESSFDTYLQATILAMHKRVAFYYVVIA